MKKNGYSNIPVYDENDNFCWILNDSRLLYWISDLLINNDYIDLSLQYLKLENSLLKVKELEED